MNQPTTCGVPSSVVCPTCQAQPGYPCRTRQEYRAATHKTRWKAVGIIKPTIDDLNKDWAVWEDYDKRRNEENDRRFQAERTAAELATKAGLTPGSPEWRAAIRATPGITPPPR